MMAKMQLPLYHQDYGICLTHFAKLALPILLRPAVLMVKIAIWP